MKKTFEEIVLFARTGLNPRQNFKLGQGHNNYITIKNIKNNTLVIDDNTDVVNDEAIRLIHKRSQIKKGDILFASIGRMGDMYIIEEDPEGWDINESVFAFTLDTSIVRQKYFYYIFKVKSTLDYLVSNSSGSTFKSIKMNQLKKMVFDIPSLEEQDQIIEAVDKVDHVIAMRKQEICLLDELIKARFIELFGDPITNTKGWKIEKAEKHIDLLSGFPFDSSQYTQYGVKICGGLIIMPQRIDWDSCKYWSSTEDLEEYTLQEKDIVMALDRPWISEGFKIAMVDADELPALLIQRTARIRAVDINQYYLMHCFALGGFDSHCNVTGSLVPHISAKDIRSFPIMLPPIELQQQFAAFVEQTDKSKAAVQKALDETQLLFDSLMQEYFG